jgi:SAM-dependent methyltransferase
LSDWEASEGEHWASNADRYTKMLANFGDVVTAAAAYATGERVLDVGCGNGDLSIAAARAVEPSGSAVGIDLSPAMVSVAVGRAASESLENVSFTVANASSFDPEPSGFDVLVSRFGVMFFDDPTAAFAHLRSLMAPGGRMVFVCWQELLANDWVMVPGAAVAEVLPLPIGGDPTAPGPFAFSDPDRTSRILTAAGFTRPEVAATTATLWMGDTAGDAVAFLRTTGLGRAVFADAEPALVAEATARAVRVLVPFESASGVELGGAAWLVTASA